jgi:hypothetical protein
LPPGSSRICALEAWKGGGGAAYSAITQVPALGRGFVCIRVSLAIGSAAVKDASGCRPSGISVRQRGRCCVAVDDSRFRIEEKERGGGWGGGSYFLLHHLTLLGVYNILRTSVQISGAVPLSSPKAFTISYGSSIERAIFCND